LYRFSTFTTSKAISSSPTTCCYSNKPYFGKQFVA